MPHLIEQVDVSNTVLKIKFLKSLKVSSITNDKFLLYLDSATPVSSPFQPIDIAEDYNSIARLITLYFADTLEADSTYKLTISGLLDAAGNLISDENAEFLTGASTVPSSTDELNPEPEGISIEDHSLKTGIFTSSETLLGVNPAFFIESTDPEQEEPLVTTNFNIYQT